MSKLLALLLPGLLLLGAPSLHAQALLDPPPPPPTAFEREIAAIDAVSELEARAAALAAEARFRDLTVVLRRLIQLQPQVGRHRFELAAAHAQLGDRQQAYDLLLRLHGQGYAFDLEADGRFGKVADTRVWEYLVANYAGNRRPFGTGAVAFELPAEDLLLESLAWDPRHGRFLFGSMRTGNILARAEDGTLSTLIEASAENGLWSVTDLLVDAARGRLWVASAAMPFFQGLRGEQFGLTGLFLFDLDSGRLERRWLIPRADSVQALTALALGRQGEIYALDAAAHAVYVADAQGMRPYFASPRHTALRSLAVSDDGNWLYVADYDAGVLAIDLARSQAHDLGVPETLTLDGIESIRFWKGHLVLVQSGTDPAMRVMRLSLAENGRQVTRAQPIDANHEVLRQPVSGALRGDAIYFLASSQKRLYGDDGRLKADAKPRPVQVFRSDLSLGLTAN